VRSPASRPRGWGAAGSPWPSPWRPSRKKWPPLDFAALAQGLGARYGEADGRGFLQLTYFGHQVQVFKDQVCYPEGVEANPWDAILLYNYLASRGGAEPTGTWITYQSLPNSVSKTKTLKRLEGELAAHFAGKQEHLEAAAPRLGGEPVQVAEDADLQLVFHPLPKVPVLLLFWEADPEEDFPPRSTSSSTAISRIFWTWSPCYFSWSNWRTASCPDMNPPSMEKYLGGGGRDRRTPAPSPNPVNGKGLRPGLLMVLVIPQ